jgi:hypothetical protein
MVRLSLLQPALVLGAALAIALLPGGRAVFGQSPTLAAASAGHTAIAATTSAGDTGWS